MTKINLILSLSLALIAPQVFPVNQTWIILTIHHITVVAKLKNRRNLKDSHQMKMLINITLP